MKLGSLLCLAGVVLLLASIAACGDDDASTGTTSGPTPGVNSQPPACAQTPAPQKVAGTCEASIEAPPLVSVIHVPEGSAISYCSNPPSSGPHYPVWAAYKEYTTPIDSPALAPYLVHSLEHGGVAILYKCDPQGCADVVDALRKVRDAVTTDPGCTADVRVRVILAPSTTITTKVAAAAWGATYQAPCVDATSLGAFIKDHYAKGPEDLCAQGKSL